MPDEIDQDHTTAAPKDSNASAAGSADETAPYGAGKPKFGPPQAADEVGTLGPYRVVKELGKGGMGAVYLAVDTRLGRKLALKVMLPEFAADRDAKERFLREARAAAQISHDNVVTVYEADERDGVPYITMQFLQGQPLDDYLRKKGAPALTHVVRIASETALGLAAAHKLGLVHRDIKPANLWLETPNGRVKVLDFGLAKPIGSDAELTKSGAVVGTPAYMSPEQARGMKVDHRTDLFSLGSVLYKLCTGQSPFTGPNVMAVLTALAVDDPTPVRELNPNVPEPLGQFIHQLLAKKPEHRPQSANEVAARLRTILAGMSNRGAPVVVSGGSSSGVSSSVPVVVDPVPHQPPIVVPMSVSAQPESAFANLTDDEDEVPEAAESLPAPEKKGGKGLLLAALGAVLLTGVAVAVVVMAMNRGKKESEGKVPETAKPEPPKSSGSPAVYKNALGMEFALVPKGTGWLGGGADKPGDRKVTFDNDFYIGKYEVTQGEWEAVMGTNPSHFSRTGEGKDAVRDVPDADLKRFPVEQVSWDDCQEFIKKLNEREKESGWVYRLPTAAEWEYACRGGPVGEADSAFDFYFDKPTNALLPEQANISRTLERTRAVGAYKANRLGLHDLHGNVWEWCEDELPTNPNDGQPLRKIQGGSFQKGAEDCRAGASGQGPSKIQWTDIGLRVVRVPAGTAPKPSAGGAWTDLTPAGETDWSKWWDAYGSRDWALWNGDLYNAAAGRRWIGTKAEYTDFEIELEFEFGAKGNTGIFLRAEPNGDINKFVEIQLADDAANKYTGAMASGSVFRRIAANPAPTIKLNEWNTARVTVVGKRVTVTVNGTKCLDADVDFPRAKGVIGLQQWDSAVHFRKVRVRDLSASADRAVAEKVLTLGGGVRLVGSEQDIRAAKNLPTEPFVLKIVNLNTTTVTDADVPALNGCAGLTDAYFQGTRIKGDGLAALAGSRSITNLDLTGTSVTDATLVHLKDLSGLKYLYLSSAPVSDAGLEHLTGLNELVALDLTRTKVTAAGAQKLAAKLPKCRIEWTGGVIPGKK